MGLGFVGLVRYEVESEWVRMEYFYRGYVEVCFFVKVLDVWVLMCVIRYIIRNKLFEDGG